MRIVVIPCLLLGVASCSLGVDWDAFWNAPSANDQDGTGTPDGGGSDGEARDARDAEADSDGAAPTCGDEQTMCGSSCVDLRSDAQHCGDCATACSGATACVSGYCVTPYYLSPTGSDTNAGTSSVVPWKTFSYALKKLTPGSALLLMDAVYTKPVTGLPNIDCSAESVVNGAPGSPIVLAAVNERQAVIQSDGSGGAIRIYQCHDWVLSGLTATNTSLSAADGGVGASTVYLRAASDIALHRLLLFGTNRYFSNSSLLNIDSSNRVLASDIEGYSFHFAGLGVGSSSDVEIRRYYANSRAASDISGGATTDDPTRGDQAIILGSPAGPYLLENSVLESTARGVGVGGGSGNGTMTILGTMTRSTAVGILADAPSSTFLTTIRDFVALDTLGEGIAVNRYADAGAVALENLTLLRTKGVRIGQSNTGTIRNTNSYAGSGVGITIPSSSEWLVEYSNSAGNSAGPFSPLGASNFSNCTELGATGIGTGTGQCVVYVPSTSNMKGLGKDGANVGANIIYRYEKGTLTNRKLWRSDGRYPCGAVLPGINDVVGASCNDVNQRFNFVPGGCTVP